MQDFFEELGAVLFLLLTGIGICAVYIRFVQLISCKEVTPMKTIIDEYGSIILCVIAGTAVLAFLGVLLSAAARFGTAFFDSISCVLC